MLKKRYVSFFAMILSFFSFQASGTKVIHFAFLQLPANAEADQVFSVPLNIKDSALNSHDLTLIFSKGQEDNLWHFSTQIDESDCDNQKSLRFDNDGLLESVDNVKSQSIEIKYNTPDQPQPIERIKLRFGDGNQTEGLYLFGEKLCVGYLTETNELCAIL